MFSRLSTIFLFVVLALATFATALPGGSPPPSSSCSTGTQVCCNSVQEASDPATALILGLLGISVGSVTGLVGIGCTLNVVASTCTQQVTCCSNVYQGGLVNVGCNNINL